MGVAIAIYFHYGVGKMFHKLSPYLLQLFFRFSPIFPHDKTETVSITGDKCLQERCKGQGHFLRQ